MYGIWSITKLMKCYTGKQSERLGNAIRRKAILFLFVLRHMSQIQSQRKS